MHKTKLIEGMTKTTKRKPSKVEQVLHDKADETKGVKTHVSLIVHLCTAKRSSSKHKINIGMFLEQ